MQKYEHPKLESASKGVDFMYDEMYCRKVFLRESEGNCEVLPVREKIWASIMQIVEGIIPSEAELTEFRRDLKIYGARDEEITNIMDATEMLGRRERAKHSSKRTENFLDKLVSQNNPRGISPMIQLVVSDDVYTEVFIYAYMPTSEIKKRAYAFLKARRNSWKERYWFKKLPPGLRRMLDEIKRYPQLRSKVLLAMKTSFMQQ